jgi:hypothetical protein
MTEWIDLTLYSALLALCWFLFPNLAWPQWLAGRNPEWFAAHPEEAKRLATSRRGRLFAYFCGAVSIAALLSYQLDLWPAALRQTSGAKWPVLYAITIVSVLACLIYLGIRAALVGARVRATVPMAERRQASLAVRSVGDFVPRWLRVATYVLVGAHLGAWIVTGALDLYVLPDFWSRFAGPFVFHAILFAYAGWAVTRPADAADRLLGPASRRATVRFAFVSQYYLLVWGGLRLYESVRPNLGFDLERALQLLIVLFILGSALVLALSSHSLKQTRPAGP